MTTTLHVSESALVDLPDRIVVAPGYGKFAIHRAPVVTAEGLLVRAGEALGELVSSSGRVPVPAPCDAWLLSHLVFDGERVRPGRPLVHLRAL